MPVTFTTQLPDAQAPTLGNGVEDEISVTIPDDTDHGDYRIQIRETGQSAWDSTATGFQEAIVASDSDYSGDITTTFVGLEDGEEYEVRTRTETEHRTGAWTSPVSIVTKFPGAVNPTIDSKTTTSVTVGGTDNADNEDGIYLERQEQIDGTWRDKQTILDAGAQSGTGAFSATDSTTSPDTTYRYRWRAYTEDASAASSWSASVTTNSLGVPQERTGSRGWVLRVEHADGSVHRPTILDDPSYDPQLNGLPSASVPVSRSEKWLDQGFENASVKLWKDGQRLPIGELTGARMQPEQTVLELRGGRELLERVSTEVDEQEAHKTARDLVQNNTGYAANVDDPASNTRGDVLMQDADTNVEFDGNVPASPFPADDPRTIKNGKLTTEPSAVFTEVEDMDALVGGDGSIFYDGRFGQGAAQQVGGIGLGKKATLTVGHDIPDGSARVGLRSDYFNDTHPAFDLVVDGTTILSISADQAYLGTDPACRWIDLDIAGGLAAGSHDVKLEVTGTASDSSDVYWDAICLFDSRHITLQDETLSNGGKLSYPRLHTTIQVETADADSIEQVVAGRLDSTWTSTANGQEVAISNDQGSTWHTSSNSSSVSATFASGSAQIRARFTLSSYDTGGGDVVYDGAAAVDVYDLYADLEDTPLLVNKSYDASLKSILSEVAEYGDFIWELQWDSGAGTYSVEWTQPGQRASTLDPDVSTYETVKKSGESIYGTAVVKGSNRAVAGERFTSNTGTAVNLGQDNLLEGSEAVYDPGTGTQYVSGDDYNMNYSAGEITVKSSGAMSDATEYAIDYRYRTQGSYTSPSAPADAAELVRDFPGATDDRECGQIALNIVKEIQEPLWEAELTVSKLEAGVSLVDDVAIPDIPTSGTRMEIRSLEQSPREVVLRLGSRKSLDEIVTSIKSRLEAVTARS